MATRPALTERAYPARAGDAKPRVLPPREKDSRATEPQGSSLTWRHTLLPTTLPRPRVPLGLAVVALLGALALSLAHADRAEARVVWCSGDPAIVVNGSVVSVTAHVPLDRLADIDHAEFIFHVPSNAKVTAVVNDSLLFEARIVVKKDLPAARGLTGTPVV